MKSSDHDVGQRLDETLHAPLDVTENNPDQDRDNDRGLHGEQAGQACLHFLCQQDPAFDPVKRMVKNFWHILKGHQIKPGAFLYLWSETTGE